MLARNAELEAVERFLALVDDGPAALVLEGPAGIGKTTLWSAGVAAAAAQGMSVLQARPTEAEAELSFAALADLAAEAFESGRSALPPRQERALATALLVAGDDDEKEPVDARTLATGFSGLLSLLARERPLLLAIDDVQWLDPASRRVLEFAVRRLDGRVGVLAARRAEPGDEAPLGLRRALPEERLTRLAVGPLSLGALHHLVRDRVGQPPPRPLLSRLVEASGGNPYFALEIARLLATKGVEPSLEDPLPLPATLQELVAGRIAALSEPAREAALVVASLSHPTLAVVLAAVGSDGEAVLAEAETAGVLVAQRGRLRFAHPLLASAALAATPAPRRRDVHRRLAGLVADAEERGRHLAHCTVAADADAADAIEDAARVAARRGAQDAAVELYEAARRVTPDGSTGALARRYLGGAQALNAVGDFTGARTLAEEALAAAGSGADRAEALVLLGELAWFNGAAPAATRHVERALTEVADERGRHGAIYAKLVRFNFSHDIPLTVRYAEAALELLDERSEPALLAHVLVDRFFAGVLLGDGARRELLERGLELEERALPDLPDVPQPMPLIWFACDDDVERARRRHALEDAWYRERGEDVWQADRQSHLAVAELRAGRWEEAERLVEASCDAVAELDVRGPRAMVFEKRALVDAQRGRVERARESLLPLIDGFERAGQHWWSALSLSTLATVELAAGEDESADDALARMRAHAGAAGVRDIVFDRSEPYHVESLLARGEVERARAALARLEERRRMLPRAWIEATLPATRALVAAHDGDPADAVAALEPAATDGPPFEAAWTLLVTGRLRRRAKQRRAAATALQQARERFERIGAVVWAARARDELDRVGLRRAAPHELTASERRVAELAASGLTNREVAKAAFISVKTVEANLARAYRKLDIRSRAELGARMAAERAGEDVQT